MRPPPLPPAAADQQGLFTARQARQSGLSDYRVRSLVSSGRWVRVIGDVLTSAGSTLDRRTLLCGAGLATGGVLSHVTAAELWTIPVAGAHPLVHVCVPPRSHTPVRGIRLNRRTVAPTDVVLLDGLRVTSRLRTIVDCLGSLPYRDAVRLLDDSLRLGLVTHRALAGRVALMSSTHGVCQLRRLVVESSTGAWSQAERVLHRLLAETGVHGWTANAPVVLPSGRRVTVDVWFSGARLAVEVDGRAWHVSARSFQTDRARQNELILAGVRVLRFTWADLTERPDWVVRSIVSALPAETSGGRPQ